MNAANVSWRGSVWARALFDGEPQPVSGFPPSVRVFDGHFADQPWRTIAVVPNPEARYRRARGGEFGLDEGLAVAEAVTQVPVDAALLAVVDMPGQAFGAREEAAGLPLALAVAVEAYATARRAGRQVFALVVGRAISGAFLAHGLQAGWIGALRHAELEVHVMSAASAARVTRLSAADLARITAIVPATARDIATFAAFGAIDALFGVVDPLAPSAAESATIRAALRAARTAGLGLRAPRERLASDPALRSRATARRVRERIAAAWDQ